MDVSIIPSDSKTAPIKLSSTIAENPRIFFEDYCHELGPMPGEALLIGKCSDELPLLINVTDEVNGHVIHVMSESRERSAEYMQTVAYAIYKQFNPFYDVRTQRPVDVRPSVTYAVITYHPEEWQAGYRYGLIPVFDANTATSHDLTRFIFETKETWVRNRQYGILMIDELTRLITDIGKSDAMILLATLMRNPHKHVRFLITSPFMDYAAGNVTPIIANDDPNDKDFTVPPGQFKVKEGNIWLTFNVLYPKPHLRDF